MRAVRCAYLGASANPVQAREIGGTDAFAGTVEERDTVSEPETFRRIMFLHNTIQESRRGSAGGEDGDTAIVAATHLSSKGGSVLLRRETATAFQTGPLLGATADSAGYALLFDPDGFPDPGCEFGCKAKIAGAFTAVGVILTTLLGG